VTQLKARTGTTWVDARISIDAPIRWFDGTRWVDLDLGSGTPDPTPVDPFDTLENLALFMDAGDPGTTLTKGAPARSWVAKRGGVTFTSPVVAGETDVQTDARAPKYYPATSSEPPFLRFGGAQRLAVDATAVPSFGGVTMYVVARMATLGYGTIFSQGSTTSVNPVVAIDCAGDGRSRGLRRTNDGAVTLAQHPLIANAWRVFSFTSTDYASLAFRANEQLAAATASAVSATGVATMNRMAIGQRVSPDAARLGGYGSPLTGDVAAVVVYSEAHDARVRAAVEQQIATRYKIVLPSQGGLPDGPPARITAARLERSIEYGIPATQRVTGKTLPGFHNTGPDVTIGSTDFQYLEGTFTTSSTGQVVSKKWINGNVIVNHAGVRFEDCIIYSTVDPKFDTRNQATASDQPLVEINRCEIFGKEEDESTGIGYIRYTVRNSFLHDCEDDTRLNKATVIENNLMAIHSNGFLPDGTRLHTDCVQANGGDNDPGVRSYVRYNTLIAQRHNLTKGNSAIILATEGANVSGVNQGSPLRRVTVEGNYLAGGSYSLYIKTAGTSGSPGPMEDIVIKDNVFRGPQPVTPATMASGISTSDLTAGAFYQYGDMWLPYASLADTFLTLTGNVREDGSAVAITRSTPGGGEAD
jgi:hypothetical protein